MTAGASLALAQLPSKFITVLIACRNISEQRRETRSVQLAILVSKRKSIPSINEIHYGRINFLTVFEW
jgi:hypothetical protein